jgi:hypothetical protein
LNIAFDDLRCSDRIAKKREQWFSVLDRAVNVMIDLDWHCCGVNRSRWFSSNIGSLAVSSLQAPIVVLILHIVRTMCNS